MSPKQDDSGWTERKPTALLVLADGTVLEGMFAGYWVIAPAISTDSPPREALRSAQFERLSLDEARARPDPSPYRTPTPEFAAPASTNYAQIARQKAQTSSDDDDMHCSRAARRSSTSCATA